MHLYPLFDLGLLIFEELPANKIHQWLYLAYLNKVKLLHIVVFKLIP